MTDTPMIPADVAAARVAAAYEAAARHADAQSNSDAEYGFFAGWASCAETLASGIRDLAAADPDGQAALARLLAEAKAEGMREAIADFNRADWYWRDLDPDDNGDTPDEAINRGMVGRYTVCHIRSSFTGPSRFCFIAPVLDPESDEDECLCFESEDEAIAAAKERAAILAADKVAAK